MRRAFFEGQEGHDARAQEIVEEASIKATSRPWTPFYLVGLMFEDGRYWVLAVNGWGKA